MSIPEYHRIIPLFESALESAAVRLRRFTEAHPDRFPTVTRQGRWQTVEAGQAGRHAGCLTGLLWSLHEAGCEGPWRERAEQYCRLLDNSGLDPAVSGCGFTAFFGGHRRWYQATALRILEALCQPEYLAGADSSWEGVLKHGVGHLPAGWAVDESVTWGDAFFVQALRQALRVLRRGSA